MALLCSHDHNVFLHLVPVRVRSVELCVERFEYKHGHIRLIYSIEYRCTDALKLGLESCGLLTETLSTRQQDSVHKVVRKDILFLGDLNALQSV